MAHDIQTFQVPQSFETLELCGQNRKYLELIGIQYKGHQLLKQDDFLGQFSQRVPC